MIESGSHFTPGNPHGTRRSKHPLLHPLRLTLFEGSKGYDWHCKYKKTLAQRPHSVTITEFGAVGDGMTMNTVAFQNAVFYLRSFADKGGAQLYVPKGKWRTGSFSLISHLTLFLDKGAIIIGSQDTLQWPVVEPLPSYGRGLEISGGCYQSLIYGENLTDVVITDSCSAVCIEDSSIAVGHDAISLKSGWDEYGIAYSKPSTKIHITRVSLESPLGSALAFGSEMSGGINVVHADHLLIQNSKIGINFKTTRGRGGFIKDIAISHSEIWDTTIAIQFDGHCGNHPDESYDANALPAINRVTIKNIIGQNISVAGELIGIEHDPFTAICLSKINMTMADSHEASAPWICSNVSGFSDEVHPEPCSDLQFNFSNSSVLCYSIASHMYTLLASA
ncbi:putative polygalacturonase [Apostasia shenzhenica]|uniref:Putative polygalacturonase n=1 Tax=Apostasia shenzhenica TaxID=1088818 RepID=A0A2I0AB14_9ASPA|nr:putative polygalacturonase [Apostasia shenzhenica]